MILDIVSSIHRTGKKTFVPLLDPDSYEEKHTSKVIEACAQKSVPFFLVGGSLISGSNFSILIKKIKELSDKPVVIFPGSSLHVEAQADAILFLSLISGRNPEFLIGQHILAAPLIKRLKMEALPTGYILIEGGKGTTVSYMSNTTPIPADKPDVAACTALAGTMLGMKLIYMDAGSGAQNAISSDMIKKVSKMIDVPLIVGGGVRNKDGIEKAWQAGADIVVLGNSLEKDLSLLDLI